MKLGWIDFSKTERDKVLDVLDLLGEEGALDELGIGVIRDGFSDLLFPGTSTIQTRAKYFLIVPYALHDLKYNPHTKIRELNNDFEKIEIKCAKNLSTKNPEEKGIIGRDTIQQKSWVKRPPSNIYLAGLKKYGIFGFKSLNQYMKYISYQKQEKNDNKYDGELNDDVNDDTNDISSKLLLLPEGHQKNKWIEDLDINLTKEEGDFLKKQIIKNCKDSMLGCILKEELYEFLKFKSIHNIKDIISKFPNEIQEDYHDAIAFSDFAYVLTVIYNIILSDGKNEYAIREYKTFENDLKERSNIDFRKIMGKLKIKNIMLESFLEEAKQYMMNEDITSLKKLIIKREKQLKHNRSKLSNIGEHDESKWVGGERLSYRFKDVKTILQDIYDSGAW